MSRRGTSILLVSSWLICFAGKVELIRDRWGIPHAFAETEEDGFYGIGYAAAEDRLLQMDLFRRRAHGRLAEVFGARWVDSDRKFRIAGIERYCAEAAANLPEAIRGYLRGYAAGVNAWMAENPERAARRLAALGPAPQPWTEGDCICSWMAVAEIFDSFVNESHVQMYHEFRQLVAEVGEQEALARRGMVIDDAAAVVPEAEMARNQAVYARLKQRPPTPGFWFRSLPDEMLRFSHAWAAGGSRTVTGFPILESDPQTSVNNPPLWYEFHLSAGRYDVRGVGAAGCPGMLIGFNRSIAWGASALGAGSAVTFVEKLAADGRGYMYRGAALPFDRRTEIIRVKDGAAVTQEVLRTRHGFIINPLIKTSQPGEVYVSHHKQLEDKMTSVLGMLEMMGAGGWNEFRDAMQWYYSPGIHVVYAGHDNNLGYQTLVQVPLTRRTPRMALEGWTGEDEVMGRIPLDEMPHMVNPAAGFISHANNLPVGSWYPYDLGISTGGIGHTARSLRLIEILRGDHKYSVDSFESAVHRDDVQAAVAGLFPAARKLAEETGITERPVLDLLGALKSWDLRYRASQPTYTAAKALSDAALLTYRRSGLATRLGGGEGGIAHLARRLKEQFPDGSGAPADAEVRAYLESWLRAAAESLARVPPGRGEVRVTHSMPYQQNGPMAFPPLDPQLDLVSPPLECGEIGTIWSQTGNSYTQIVDLEDTDNSRTLLPPGISEDPGSPFHADQMPLWVRGTTHPAPLSRRRVEELAVSRTQLETRRTSGAWQARRK